MNIVVNGEKLEHDTELMLSELLQQQGVENPEMVSVQINGEFVDREAIAHQKVSDGDEVEFLFFLGGGA